jgi:hypothetical protein
MNILTLLDAQRLAPSLTTTQHSTHVSAAYQQYPTVDVLKIILAEGWQLIEVRQTRVRSQDHRIFAKHLVRCIHPDYKIGNDYLSLVLINSHDGTCAYRFYTGVFRVICSNGLILGLEEYALRVPHRYYDPSYILQISKDILVSTREISTLVTQLQSHQFTQQNELELATAAYTFYLKDLSPLSPVRQTLTPEVFLVRRRLDDYHRDAWTIFNVIQENGMKGFVDHHIKTRAIKSIDREIRFNTSLAQYVLSNYI